VKRVLLAVLALGAAAAIEPVTPASAAFGSDSHTGGCFYNTVGNDTVTGDRNVGEIGDLSVTTDAAGAATFATVSCWIVVNDVEAPGTRITTSGNGVQAAASLISFAASDGDIVAMCEQYAYADGTTERVCGGLPEQPFPPEWVLYVINAVNGDVLAAEVAYVDPVVCPVLVQLAGSYPGGVTIGPDGDTYLPDPLGLGVNPFWDCPPYGNF